MESPNNKSLTSKATSNLHKQDIPRASDFNLRVVLGKGSFGKVRPKDNHILKIIIFHRKRMLVSPLER